jgi:hypothetical protein
VTSSVLTSPSPSSSEWCCKTTARGGRARRRRRRRVVVVVVVAGRRDRRAGASAGASGDAPRDDATDAVARMSPEGRGVAPRRGGACGGGGGVASRPVVALTRRPRVLVPNKKITPTRRLARPDGQGRLLTSFLRPTSLGFARNRLTLLTPSLSYA